MPLSRFREVLLPRSEQPAELASINDANPLTRGLQLLRNQAHEGGAGLISVAAPRGTLVRGVSATSGGKVLPETAMSTSGTIFFLGRAPTTTANEYLWDGATSADRDLFARVTGGLFIWYVGGQVIADSGGSIDSGLMAGGDTAVTLRWSPTASEVWRNGSLYAVRTGSTGASSRRSVRLYSRFSSNEGAATGGLYLWALWNRWLLDAEISALSSDPWQLFQAQSIWVPVSAAGSLPTLSASTFKPGTLSSSGWTARITAS